MNCIHHPQVEAEWQCVTCQQGFCDQCVKVMKFGTVKAEICPACGGKCQNLTKDSQLAETAEKPFWANPFAILFYPFAKDGLIMLIIGSIVSIIPIISLIIYPYLLLVISSSAQGDRSLPDWPDFSDLWDNLILPSLRFGILSILLFLPFTYAMVVIAPKAEAISINILLSSPVLWVIFLASLSYYPMALLIMAVTESLTTALNPINVVSSILNIFKEYIIALLFFYGLIAIQIGLSNLTAIGGIGWLNPLIHFYFLLVGMHLLGIIYFQYKRKLGWFRNP